jgi:hypothetical protein
MCVEKKNQLDVTEWLIALTMFNMSRVLLCPSSGARDYMCIITAEGGQCLVAGCWRSGVGQQAIRPGRGMLLAYRWFYYKKKEVSALCAG